MMLLLLINERNLVAMESTNILQEKKIWKWVSRRWKNKWRNKRKSGEPPPSPSWDDSNSPTQNFVAIYENTKNSICIPGAYAPSTWEYML
jgi:hypothetical protein